MPTSTASRVDFPAFREPPAHVVRGLREVDPRAELLYAGDGAWVLGIVEPNAHRRGMAERVLDAVTKHLENGHQKTPTIRGRVLEASLTLQGFRPVTIYRTPEPDWSVVEDFRRADWTYRHEADRAFRANADYRQTMAAKAQEDAAREWRSSAEEVRKDIVRRGYSFRVAQDLKETPHAAA